METVQYNVLPLSSEELVSINGGGKIGDALKAAWEAIKIGAEWVWYEVRDLLDIENPNVLTLKVYIK